MRGVWEIWTAVDVDNCGQLWTAVYSCGRCGTCLAVDGAIGVVAAGCVDCSPSPFGGVALTPMPGGMTRLCAR